jgi:hypothetical protein
MQTSILKAVTHVKIRDRIHVGVADRGKVKIGQPVKNDVRYGSIGSGPARGWIKRHRDRVVRADNAALGAPIEREIYPGAVGSACRTFPTRIKNEILRFWAVNPGCVWRVVAFLGDGGNCRNPISATRKNGG